MKSRKTKTVDAEAQGEDRPVTFVGAKADVEELHKASGKVQSETSEPLTPERKLPGRLRAKLDGKSTTRFDEPIKGNALTETKGKRLWKHAAEQIKVKSREESYDFFTRIWIDETPSLVTERGTGKASTSMSAEQQETEITNEDVVDQPIETTSDRTALLNGDRFLVTRSVPVHYIPYRERAAQDAATLFTPLASRATISSKVEDGVEPRNLEEEGLFVGDKPYMTRSNVNIIENRFITQGEKQWFTEAGAINRLDDPVSGNFYHHVDRDEEGDIVSVFVPAQPSDHINTPLSSSTGMLDLEFQQLMFKHHPLFTVEHVLSEQLKEAYNNYVERTASNVTHILAARLQVLRESFAKIKDARSLTGRQSLHDEIDQTRRCEIYRREIRECRRAFYVESERDRQLLTAILRLWKELKDVRQKNGYQVTPAKLVIMSESVEIREEQKKKYQAMQEETEERDREYAEIYQEKLTMYEKQIEDWKTRHRLRKDSKQRQTARLNCEALEDDETLLQAAQDEALLAMPEMEKPEPPKFVSREDVMQEVTELFNRCLKPPGEPNVHLELTSSGIVSRDEECPGLERQRQQLVGRTKVWVKVYIDNKLVTETPSSTLASDFSVHIAQSFRVSLSAWPERIRLEFLEGRNLRTISLGSVLLPVPGKMALRRETFEHLEFSSTLCVDPTYTSVGAGHPDSPYGSSFTTGCIQYRTGWALGQDGVATVPPGMPSKIGLPRQLPNNVTREWFQSSEFDPNDPHNAVLLNYIQKTASGTVEPSSYFELDHIEGEFCSEAELDSNVRLRVLRLRDEGVPEFKALKMVPAVESQILRKSLEKYEGKLDPGDDRESGNSLLFGLDRRWEQVEKVLSSLRRHLQFCYTQASSAPKLEDLVREEQIPDIGMLGISLLSIFKARRPLKPARRARGQVRGVALTDQNVNLIIHIARAFHVPMRQEASTAAKSKIQGPTDVLKSSCSVRPFVEVSFQQCCIRTSIAEGPNPTWNQQLTLPFMAPNSDFSPASLRTVTDNIYFHLFDEVVQDLLDDDRLRETTVHHRLEKRWLGSLKVPFSTVYSNVKIEGTFSLESPIVLLGYLQDPLFSENQLVGETEDKGSFLTLYLTLEPTLPPPEAPKAQFESTEPESLVNAGLDWVATLNSRFPNRHFRTHVLDLSGKLVSILRFIRPLKPPSELQHKNLAIYANKVAWFVSLIPSLADMTVYPGACDIWANSEQFLSMMTGDEEEHAVLLTNFFLQMGIVAFLLIGNGIPEGVTCYVLTQEDPTDWLLWNPSTGQSYNVHDAFSPLKEVFMLANAENLWANIQKYTDPPHMRFAIGNSADWRPFLSHTVPDPGLPSVQPSKLKLPKGDPVQVEQLQERLEITLRDAVMKWRSALRTPWNRHVISVLRKLVRGLEEPRSCGKKAIPDLSQLASIFASHKLCGVCVHQGYSTMAALVEAVHATGIHLTQDPEAEFALAVHVVPYAGSVISIWVYVASMVRRN